MVKNKNKLFKKINEIEYETQNKNYFVSSLSAGFSCAKQVPSQCRAVNYIVCITPEFMQKT